MSELNGKVAIVTGAGRGIGEQVARKLADSGAHVIVADRDGDEAEAVVAALATAGSAHVGDLTAPGVCDALVAHAVDTYGKLDIVVNSALRRGRRR
jgi:3-oxoacyl-[acyl-carrier protein] reductase